MSGPHMLTRFLADRRGSAVRWFAYAAAGLTVSCVACAQGLSWLAQSGRMPAIAFLPAKDRGSQPAAANGIDPLPTGSVDRHGRERIDLRGTGASAAAP